LKFPRSLRSLPLHSNANSFVDILCGYWTGVCPCIKQKALGDGQWGSKGALLAKPSSATLIFYHVPYPLCQKKAIRKDSFFLPPGAAPESTTGLNDNHAPSLAETFCEWSMAIEIEKVSCLL